jgi:hypothetical protein
MSSRAASRAACSSLRCAAAEALWKHPRTQMSVHRPPRPSSRSGRLASRRSSIRRVRRPHHYPLRWPGCRKRRIVRHPKAIHSEPDRAERSRKDGIFKVLTGLYHANLSLRKVLCRSGYSAGLPCVADAGYVPTCRPMVVAAVLRIGSADVIARLALPRRVVTVRG